MGAVEKAVNKTFTLLVNLLQLLVYTSSRYSNIHLVTFLATDIHSIAGFQLLPSAPA